MLKVLALALTLLSFRPALAEPKTVSIKLTPKNTIVLREEVSFESTTRTMLELIRLNKDRGAAKYPLYLVLDSPGGSIFAGMAFSEFLATFKNVHTISLFAASMASAIVELNPGKRYVTESGILMFHRAKGGFEGQFEEGEVEQQLRLWKAIVRQLESKNAARMGLPLAEYKNRVKDEYWLLGEEAVQQGAVDAIAKVSCSEELIDKRDVSVVAGIFANVEVVFSGCPLIRGPVETSKL